MGIQFPGGGVEGKLASNCDTKVIHIQAAVLHRHIHRHTIAFNMNGHAKPSLPANSISFSTEKRLIFSFIRADTLG